MPLLRQLGLAALILSLAMLGLISYLSYQNWRRFHQSSADAEQTRKILSLSQELLDHLRDAETGQRGFLLTGRQEYLAPYESSAAEVPRTLQQLAELCRNRDDQPRRIAELRSLSGEKLAELRQTVELRRASGPALALSVVLSDRGKQIMDRIRLVSRDLERKEDNRLRSFAAALQAQAQQTRLLTLFGAAVLTVLVGGAFVALRRAGAQRDRLIGELERSRDTTVEIRDLLQTTLYSIGDGVITTDSHGNVRMMNAVAERLTGFSEQESLGKPIESVFHIVNEHTRAVVESPVRRVLRDGQVVGLANHTVLISKSGSDVPLDDSGAPIRLRDGSMDGAVLVFRDVSERRRAEASFQRLCEANIVGIVAADPERIFEANDVFLKMLGYTRQELMEGQIRWRSITPPEYFYPDAHALQELETAGASTPAEREYIRKDGARIPVLTGATLLQQSPVQWLCFVLDLTERKALEKKLFETQKLEGVGRLAGGIAHDFNNILVGILGNASLAQDLLPRESPVNELLADVVKSAERAAHLTRQMLAYSGQGRYVVEPVSLSTLVRETTDLVLASISRKIELRLNLAPTLPKVHADAGQLRQVIMNLLTNAAEAIGENAGRVSVSTGVQHIDEEHIRRALEYADIPAGDYVYVEVSDTGCGMDESTRTKIFDPFFTTKFTGRGLGLAAVAGIIRGHRGAIQVVSSIGEGSMFRVLLPVEARGVQAPPAPVPRPQTAARQRVLVVDDEEIVLRTAKLALERHGYAVLLADSGPAAIELLRTQGDQVSIVLLDVGMPGMSGQEVLAELRKIREDIQVIVSSGYSEVEVMRLFADQRVAGFAQKPYTPVRLAEKVKEALASPVHARGQGSYT